MTDKILFAHIGKSAGTTIGEIFRALVGDSRVFWVEEPEVLTRDQAGAVDAGDYTFVYGQLRFDQEDWFPSYRHKFTIVREPVSRVISTYGYLRQAYAAQRPNEPFMTFDEFIRSHDLLVKNNQSRQLLGVEGFSEFSPAEAEELVDSKASRLRRFEVIGLFEQLQRTFDLISWRFALPRLQSAVAVNVTRDGYKPNPSQDAIAFVERANRIDRALYRRVALKFERSVGEMMDDLIARSYFQATSRRTQRAGNSSTLEFGDPVPGTGWFGIVRDDTSPYRWAAGGCGATVHIDVQASTKLLIRVEICYVMRETNLQELEVRIDGTPRPFRVYKVRGIGLVLFTSALSDPRRPGRVLSLRARTWRGPVPEDGRALAFAVRRVRTRALSHPWPIEDAATDRLFEPEGHNRAFEPAPSRPAEIVGVPG